jgi:hypothetical protein
VIAVASKQKEKKEKKFRQTHRETPVIAAAAK